MNEKLLIIDGFNLLSRGYFATAFNQEPHQLPKNSQGLYINGIRVFIQKLYQLIDKHQMSHVAICWDVKREDTSRRKEYTAYKATRQALPEPLIQQYESLVFLLTDLGFTQLTIPPYEADDVIGALTVKWQQETSGHSYMYSNDHDLLQLLSPQTTQIIAKNREELMFTEHVFTSKYEITPTQWIDVKALLGDKGDNIPGVHGVGEKAALPLIQLYGSVEGVYQSLDTLDAKFNRYKKKLIAGETDAYLSKQLVTIETDLKEVQTLDLVAFENKIRKDLQFKALNDFDLKIRGLML